VYYITSYKNGPAQIYPGSTEGGTLLWIIGIGFAQNGFSTLPSIATTYEVQLSTYYAAYDCNIFPDELTDTQLACYTSAMPDGTYYIQIYESGQLIWSNQCIYGYGPCTFQSSSSFTPAITGITPATGLPQRLVSLTGDFKTQCYSSDIPACSSDGTSLISR
jgi:hypothetical protein